MRFYASNMVLNIHSDASYLSEPCSQSCVVGHFFLGWIPKDNKSICLNGAIFTLYTIPKFIMSLAVKEELGTLFLNIKEGRMK